MPDEVDPPDVLLVGDPVEGLSSIEQGLEEFRANIVLASSARVALRQVQLKDFAVILLDMELADPGAYEAATMIRSRERARNTPIVFLTPAPVTEATVFRGYAGGAVDYLQKPVVPQILHAKVAVFLDLARVRSRLARALADAERHSACLFEQACDAILVLGADGAVREANLQAETMLGTSRAKMVGRAFVDVVAPQAMGEFLSAVSRLGAERVARVEGLALRRADGELVRVDVSACRVRDGQDQSILLSLRDVSPQRRAHDVFRSLFEANLDGLVIVDQAGRIRLLNPAAERMFGVRSQDVVGRDIEGLLPKRFRERHREHRSGYNDQARPRPMGTGLELFARRGDGREFPVDIMLIPLLEQGEGMVLAEIRDLSERAEMEAEASRLREALHRAQLLAAMGALVGGVAHEVRNPLFGISATIDALEVRLGPDGAHAEYLAHVRREIARLNHLVTDLITYGKPPVVDLELASLASIVSDAVASCAAMARRQAVEVATHHAGARPIMVDRSRLHRALVNVVENAIQHSPADGAVEVTVGEASEGDSTWVECRIRDRGRGFSVADIPRAFEPFFSRREGGVGLGLGIVQRIVGAHGGTVELSNHPEGGTEVTIRLPASPEAASDGDPVG